MFSIRFLDIHLAAAFYATFKNSLLYLISAILEFSVVISNRYKDKLNNSVIIIVMPLKIGSSMK